MISTSYLLYAIEGLSFVKLRSKNSEINSRVHCSTIRIYDNDRAYNYNVVETQTDAKQIAKLFKV